MDKYDCRFFPNGRVAFILKEDIDAAILARKEILVICNSWSGGYAKAIGANVMPNWDFQNGTHTEMYSYEVKDREFTTEELQKFYKVIITSGEKIMMKSGNEATFNHGNKFVDYGTKKPCDISDIRWDELVRTVDAQSTICFIDDDEKAECLSNYYCGIDWTGTKFERKDK